MAEADERGSEERTALEERRIGVAYARRQSLASRYSHLDPAHLYMVQERARGLLGLLRSTGFRTLRSARVLEVGCGDGQLLTELITWGARPEDLTGVDLLPARIAEARSRCPADVRLETGRATALCFADGTFDIVLQATVFSSILDPEVRRCVAAEMLRVTKPRGLILWYDFFVNNPRNPDVRAVTRPEIRRLFPNCAVTLRRLSLAPPIARAVAPRSSLLCRLLGTVPLLCTHYVGLIRPRA